MWIMEWTRMGPILGFRAEYPIISDLDMLLYNFVEMCF